MKKYLMNKNVEHNGKPYLKGQEIKDGDDGFESIVKSGHADELKFEEKGEAPKGESEEQSEQPKQSGKQSKR